jgi:hypothetical protein
METKSIKPKKKAYHTPELQSFGSVKEGTMAGLAGLDQDGNHSSGPYNYTYSSP